MKKSIIKIVSFVFCVLTGHNLLCQNPQLREYYSHINQAELAICKEDYKAADVYYQKAFASHTPFTKDVIFAFKLYHKYLHDNKATLDCIHIFCQRDMLFDDTFDTIQYSDLWQQAKNMRDTTHVIIIPELNQALDELYEADQSVREYFTQTNCSRDTLAYIDSINLVKLRQLYLKYGGINEEMAHIHTTHILHLHNVPEVNPKDILLKEVLAGNFRADVYADLLDESLWRQNLPTKYGCGKAHARIIGNTLFIFEPEDIQQINQNRAKISMAETWEDYMTKVVFRHNNPRTDFYFHYAWMEWREDADTVEEEFKRKIDNKEIKGSYYTP